MSVRQLPDRPDLDQLRRQAKELRDAARAAAPGALDRMRQHVRVAPPAPVPLSAAQLVIAREHGFPSWPRLKAEVEARTLDAERRAAAFLEAIVDGRTARAERLLAGDPAIATYDIATAAALGEAGHVARLLDGDRELATRPDERRGWPPLLYVCHSRWHRLDPARAAGMREVARLLLDAGASPDTSSGRRSRSGYRSALYGAAGIAGNPDLVGLLLDRGADPNDDESLYHAAGNADHACLRLLVGHGAVVDGTNALAAAIGRGDLEAVRILLDGGGDPGRPFTGPAHAGHLPDRSLNPLPLAAASDSAAVVEALLAAGADPDAPCGDGRSPVRASVRRGAADVAEALLRHGARDDATDVDRFLGACARGDRAGAEALRPAAAGLSDEDRAAIVDAAEAAGPPAVALMLDLGFPADAHRPADGATAMHAAAYLGRADVVRLLIERGAEVDRRDRRWRSTPLCWAAVGSGEREGLAGDWPGTIAALLDAGASREGVWVEGKPPGEEAAALLISLGVVPGERPEEEPPPAPPDPGELERIAERLRGAFAAEDPAQLGSLLHDDVRWGTCHSRAQVLEWYGVLRDQGVHARVGEALVRGDRVVLEMRLARPARTMYQVFRVAGGAVVEITGSDDREEALAALE